MHRRNFIRTLGIAAALAAFVGSFQTANAQTVLRFGHYGTAGDSAYAAADRFAELVAQKTEGTLQVNVFPAGELGNSPTMLEGARLGTIDIVLTGNPYFTGFAPQLNLLDLPFLFQSEEHAYAVLDGPVGQALLGSLNESGLQGLALWEIGFRNLTNAVRPIRAPSDLAGLKIRTTPNPAHVLAFQILGANPTPMPFREVYTALQTGAIDGQENPVNHIYANRLHEVQTHLSLTAHAYTAAPLVMNRGRFAALSGDQQTALVEAALEAAAYERALNAERNDESLQAMIDAGMDVIHAPDVAAFRQAVAEATRAAYIEQHGGDLLAQVVAQAE